MHQHPLLAHHLPGGPLPRNGQNPRVTRAGVGDQARLLEPLPGDQVQPVGIHAVQHVAAIAGQDHQLFMACGRVLPYLKRKLVVGYLKLLSMISLQVGHMGVQLIQLQQVNRSQ